MCHNDLRDFTATLLTEVCPNVCIEPPLQALTGELLLHDTSISEDGACLDVSAQGFWGDRHQRAFFDARVFDPNTSSYRKMQLPSAHRLHDRQKQRSYNQRVREIEHGSFKPLVFPHQQEWGSVPLWYIRDWPLFYLPSKRNIKAQLLDKMPP